METVKQALHLTEDQKQWILKSIGYCLSVQDIVSQANEAIGRDISETCVKQWLAKPEQWRPYREEYSKNIDDIPIAHAKYRLELLDRATDRDIETNQGRSLATLIREGREEVKMLQGGDTAGQNIVIVQAEAQQGHAYRDILSKYGTRLASDTVELEPTAPPPSDLDTV